MKTTPISPADLQASVISVPPLCRDAQLRPHAAENARLIKHIESGGVTTLLYGGNANFYNIALSEFEAVLDQLEAAAGPDTLIVPAFGPYFGTAMDQAAILAKKKFPTAMLLPTVAVSSPKGVQAAVMKLVEKYGKPIVLYIKDQGYVTLDVVKALVAAGAISWIKYAVVRADPAQDDLLAGLVKTVDPKLIVSGIGEQPAIVHWQKFGIHSFTSGCVCVAPRRSQEMLNALRAGDTAKADAIRERFNSLETLRNTYGPIPVLHHAVSLAGIAETGPALPLIADLGDDVLDEVLPAAQGLLAWNKA
ncbi:MAG: dihydrodipicolinate synthase family protein [Chthoniobacter sp.]|uniref:dihydrodipicolinate synthase family protein n=1 Tax=Chthoniobacter sp. TaxID=2510640 RepID=UPI0032A3B4A4